MYALINAIRKDKRVSQQQKRTLIGQIKAGDVAGALKGFERIINRTKGEGTNAKNYNTFASRN